MFSFNAPLGCCPDCKGVGIKREVAIDILVPNEELSLNQGAIRWHRNIAGSKNIEWQEFVYLCKQYRIDMDKPYKDLTKKEKDIVIYGSDKPFKYVITSANGNQMHREG